MYKKISYLFLALFSCIQLAFAAEVNVFMVGCGLVGEELLNQIDHQNPSQVNVVGLANSKKMVFDTNGIELGHWKELLNGSDESMSLEEFINKMAEFKLPNTVFVDCSANQDVANAYASILNQNIAIVTPNKKANTGKYEYYATLQDLSAQNHVKYFYDANVGAGLPIIKTIKSIKRAGDSVVKLEAILSGTLSYLFNTFDGSVPFSQVLRDAQQKGYTEPDPRDDLNGMDMGRKFLILARESGYALEMSDIDIEQFIPKECFEASSVAEFYQKLADFDQQLTALANHAKQEGKALRFMGTLENGKAALSLKAISQQHPFSQLSDSDNIALISTKIYCKNPIVIKGPGAGASVTASNVLSNIIQILD